MNNNLLYLTTVFIWGSTWIAINFQLGEVSTEASIVYRFAIAALCMFVYCRYKGLSLRFSSKQHLQFIAFGLTLFSGNYYFLYSAQTYINSALACIAFSTLMLINIINARLWFKTKISSQTYFGGALGLVGIVTLFWPQLSDVAFGKHTFLGLGLAFLGVLCASMGNMISIKNHHNKMPIFPATAWGMLYGCLFMLLMVLLQGGQFSFSLTFNYISSLLYLAVFGSVIAFSCYLTLLNRIGPHKASYVTIMFPAVAIIISTLFEGFIWDYYTVTGLIMMLLGNLVVLAKNGIFKRLFLFRLNKVNNTGSIN